MPNLIISWSGIEQAQELFSNLEDNSPFALDVLPQDQIDAWNQVLDDSRAEEVVAADGDGSDLTLALLEKALDLRHLLPLAALLAFAIARNYTLTFKKTKTTVSFSFGPGDGAVHANISASIALPDFGKLETALQGLATAVDDLQPKTAQLETQAAKVQQLAPATGASLQQDLTGFSDILGDVIEVVQLLAKVEILEEVFDFVDVASKLQSIQAQITSLQTQASDLDHEVTVVNTLLGQLNNPTQQLSTQLQSVAQQNTKSWQPTYSAVPGYFKLAEKANQQEGGKLTTQIQQAALVYTKLLADIEPVLATMTTAVGNAEKALPAVTQVLHSLGAKNSSLGQTRDLLTQADSLLQAVDGAKSRFDLVGQLVKPLQGLLGELNLLVGSHQQLNPANPSTKADIDQAIAALLPIGKLLDNVDGTLTALQQDTNDLQAGIKDFSAATSALLSGATSVTQSIQLSKSAQSTLEKLANAVGGSQARPAIERLLRGEPGPVRDWTASSLRHAVEVLACGGNAWLEAGRDRWSALIGAQTFAGSLAAAGMGTWADADSLAELAAAVTAARDSGAYTDPYTSEGA